MALEIGKFHDRYKPTKIVSIENFATQFIRLTRKMHLVGAVISFDADRLWRLLRAANECPLWHYHLIDVEALAVGYLAQSGTPISPPWKSNDLTDLLGLEVSEADKHTALGDARWAKLIYEKVMGT